jgi:amidophosphoribosyltransferase
MCGIIGVAAHTPVNQLLYDGLLLLQHRGQDAAGIVTSEGPMFHMHKGSGYVRDVFRTRNMRDLSGTLGIGHCRYPPLIGGVNSSAAVHVNSPFGIMLGHNGNLTNTAQLQKELFLDDCHINTNSDSEVLLNVLALELERAAHHARLDANAIFTAVAGVHRRCRGAYAIVSMIAGYGLLAFRDPFGIRPLIIGVNEAMGGTEYVVASESVALEALGFAVLRDVEPGEAVFIDQTGQFHSRHAPSAVAHPCIFEYVYLARPDSVIDGVSVYQARLNMGETLAQRLISTMPPSEIDVVIPIPESSRPSAMQLAQKIGKPYREGFVKNRYVGRTFIMPGQGVRKKSVRQKLNAIAMEFKGRNVLLVDDSIVRGTTSKEIVQMAREAGARKVYMASAAPPVRYPNVYGIDMPTKEELVAHGRTIEQIREFIGADQLIYQDVDAMKRVVSALNPAIRGFEASCFDGHYVTGDVTAEDFAAMQAQRRLQFDEDEGDSHSRLALQGAQEGE